MCEITIKGILAIKVLKIVYDNIGITSSTTIINKIGCTIHDLKKVFPILINNEYIQGVKGMAGGYCARNGLETSQELVLLTDILGLFGKEYDIGILSPNIKTLTLKDWK